MKPIINKEHKIDTFFSVLLFALFLIFILAFLLFSASVYRAANRQTRYGYGLSTALSYVTEKVHHYDRTDGIFLGELDGIPSLCLRDEMPEQNYITYIYQKDGKLMELFTRENSSASASMGSVISNVSIFHAAWTDYNMLEISIIDSDNNEGTIYLHPKCQTGGIYDSI